LFAQEGRKITNFSGFKGKGFRFDETEAQLADERKKLQKAALGLQDSDEEDGAMDVSIKLLLDLFVEPGCDPYIRTFCSNAHSF
jgi:hypothetical protein